MIKLLLFIIIMCVLTMLVFAFIGAANKARRERPWSKNYDPNMLRERDEPDPLLQLSKKDYDFMRDNGVSATQAVHDHFYPPYRISEYDVLPTRQSIDRWGVNAIDFETEARARIAEGRLDGAEEERQRFIELDNQANELLGSVIRVGTPPRDIIMDANGIRPALEWTSWIDSEKVG